MLLFLGMCLLPAVHILPWTRSMHNLGIFAMLGRTSHKQHSNSSKSGVSQIMRSTNKLPS